MWVTVTGLIFFFFFYCFKLVYVSINVSFICMFQFKLSFDKKNKIKSKLINSIQMILVELAVDVFNPINVLIFSHLAPSTSGYENHLDTEPQENYFFISWCKIFRCRWSQVQMLAYITNSKYRNKESTCTNIRRIQY